MALEYTIMAEFGKKLLSSPSLESGLGLISEYSKSIIGAERCSVFIYDEERSILWTTLADGIEKIEIDADVGIAGAAKNSCATVVENNVANSKKFYHDVDRSSGFMTENLIATPIISSANRVLGVLELLNKAGGFSEKDRSTIEFFARFVSGFVELAPLLPDN